MLGQGAPGHATPFPEETKWVVEGYDGPLDTIVLDEHTPQTDARIEEVNPEEYYTLNGLRIERQRVLE